MNIKDLKPAKDFAQKFGVKAVVYGPAGSGKCLAPGTPVLMFDGSIKNVENVKVDDLLMGPDSLPRRVVSLAHGFEEMFDIIPVKGDVYRVNRSHILSLWISSANGYANLTIDQYLNSSENIKRNAKGWRTGVEFANKHIIIHPYLLGLWLGDGSSDELAFHTIDKEIVEFLETSVDWYGVRVQKYQNGARCPRYRLNSVKGDNNRAKPNRLMECFRHYGLFNNKHVPFDFKTNSKQIRLEVLAGLMDTDGSLSNGVFDFISKFEKLADDVCYLARSVGLAAYKKACNKSSQNGTVGVYYRVSISGDVSIIPCKLKRKQASKRKQIKSVLHTGISVKYAEFGEYFGFELEGPNKLFLLGDFTVTHNTPIMNTAPRPVLLATEPGLLSMRHSTIPTWLAPDTKRIDEFFNWFFNSAETKVFDTLCIDSSSQMCDIALQEVKKTTSHGLQQYGKMAEYVEPYMRRLYFMPEKHMYMVAKEETTDSGFRKPYYPGKQLPTNIPHLYDVIIRVAKVPIPNIGEQTAFQCNGSYDIMARNRTGDLETYEPPDFSALVKKVMS